MKTLVAIFSILLASPFLWGQESFEALEAKKREQLGKIQSTREVLSKLSAQEVEGLSELEAISAQITEYEHLLHTLAEEQNYLAAAFRDAQDIAHALESDLNDLRKEYGQMIYNLSKKGSIDHTVYFLIASQSFSQLMARISYMRQYQSARRRQIEHIMATQDALNTHRESLRKASGQSDALAEESHGYLQQLDSLQALQERKVAAYAQEAAKAASDLQQLRRDLEAINRSINQALKNSMARRSEEVSIGPGATASTISFADQKGRLPWPVENGFISGRFGKHPHPAMAGVMVENLGIDINTGEQEPVLAVFGGLVTAVTEVPGMHQMVMLQHQEFFTVYAKLEGVRVQVGDYVEKGHQLGHAATNADGMPQVQFQLWQNHTKRDPEDWLAN